MKTVKIIIHHSNSHRQQKISLLCAISSKTVSTQFIAVQMSMKHVGVAALSVLGASFALFKLLGNTKQSNSSNNRSKRNSSPSSLPSFKFQSKAVAHKIASTIIAEKSLKTISDEELVQLMELGTQLLDDEPARVAVQAPCYVFGDIHGNLQDFLKFFSDAKVEPQLLKLQPPICNLLFLGDYVDRGPCSLEVVALLVSLKLLFRDKVTLLRGNHEIMALNKDYTFREEVKRKRAKCYDRIYKRCNKLFTKLPLCAVISKTFLCMHGGLPRPEGWDFLMGNEFRKPSNDDEIDTNDTFCDLLWADPTNNSQELCLDKENTPDDEFLGDYGNYRFNATRETSIEFNDRFAQEFFDRFPNIRGIIRAHENCPQGHRVNDARTICTVFSAPRYHDETDCGSVLEVSADLKNMHFITLKPNVGIIARRKEPGTIACQEKPETIAHQEELGQSRAKKSP